MLSRVAARKVVCCAQLMAARKVVCCAQLRGSKEGSVLYCVAWQ